MFSNLLIVVRNSLRLNETLHVHREKSENVISVNYVRKKQWRVSVWVCEKRQKEVTKKLWVILSGAFTYLELIIVQMNLTACRSSWGLTSLICKPKWMPGKGVKAFTWA
jgi:hypothetical protein